MAAIKTTQFECPLTDAVVDFAKDPSIPKGYSIHTHNGSLGVKSIWLFRFEFLRYMHDAGVVESPHSHYVVVVFTFSKQLNPRKSFAMSKVAKVIFEHMEKK